MGDRAVIHFMSDRIYKEHCQDESPETFRPNPGIYLHWGGSMVEELLQQTKELMAGRTDDAEYTTARCIGLAHEMNQGNMGLGVWNSPPLEEVRS